MALHAPEARLSLTEITEKKTVSWESYHQFPWKAKEKKTVLFPISVNSVLH